MDVSFKPAAVPKSAGTAASNKTTKKRPIDDATQKQMSSAMNSWISGAAAGPSKRVTAETSCETATTKPCVEQVEAAGPFVIRFSRVSKVIEWDDATFSDCRPSEARDSMDEHIRAAKRYDCSDKLSDEVDGGNEATHQQLRAVGSFFDTVGEANEAAKQCMVKMLELEVEGDRRILTAVRAVNDAEWSTGFKPPPSSKNPAEALGADGRGTYTGKVTLFCDAHGCDVHNVVVSDLKAVVVRAPVPG